MKIVINSMEPGDWCISKYYRCRALVVMPYTELQEMLSSLPLHDRNTRTIQSYIMASTYLIDESEDMEIVLPQMHKEWLGIEKVSELCAIKAENQGTKYYIYKKEDMETETTLFDIMKKAENKYSFAEIKSAGREKKDS